MKDSEYLLNPNTLVKYLRKPTAEFTKYDIMRFIEENEIEMLNFRYVAEDGKLKTLNFVLTSKEHLETILSTGERVDGSSLFSYVGAASSDLYVIPRFNTAFVDPFAEVPTLNILCSFYTSEGKPLESAPEYILRKAHREFKLATGMTFRAMGELEFYIISEKETMYAGTDQKGYHTSQPYCKWENLRKEAMRLIAQTGGKIKYGHSEVGFFTDENYQYEQHEIEFLPVDVEDTADQIVTAKWILRMLGNQYGVNISFAPKITVGKAGSGMHIHMQVDKDGENMMANENGLTETAHKVIAGLLQMAAPLTAMGNTVPISYLRLVPHQEAPTNICWGDSNRSALVRVPLGWLAKTSMIKNANPQETGTIPYIPGKQTVELRTPDGSADVYHLLAGIVVAAQLGLEDPNALQIAKDLYVAVNIFKDENKAKADMLKHLPTSCWESADLLNEHRAKFEKNGVFPAGTIDRIIKHLKAFDDKDLSVRLYQRYDEIAKLVEKYFHWM